MLTNPYTPGGRPRVFVGREAERRRLRDGLARVLAFGEMMGPLTVVTGPRGLGKTSLLRELQSQAEAQGFVVAWVSGVKQQPVLGELVDRVTRAVERTDPAPRRPRGGRPTVSELGLEVGVGLARVSATLRRPEEAATPPTSLVGTLEDFLHAAAHAVRERGGAGILVLVDELHAPLESRREREYLPDAAATLDVAVLLNAVQNMEGERERHPLGVVGAGLPETKGYLTRAATFGERARELVLAEFDELSAEEVLVAQARAMGVGWDDDALAAAVAASGGYPQSLQVIGSAVWDVAQPAEGDVLTAAHLEAAREAIRADHRSMFRARWEVATEAEKAFLVAMASLTEGEVERGAIAEALGVHTEALGMTRRSLISKGIIEAPRHGVLRFTIPGFGNYLRHSERLPRLGTVEAEEGPA